MTDIEKKIINFLEDKKAENIEYYNLVGKNPFFDSVIVCTALNTRQLESLADNREDYLAQENHPIHYIDGTKESGWLVVDGYDVIVHIFSVSERERVNLDELLASISDK